MKRTKNKSIEGFSIIELMIVLVIISIMAGITGFYLKTQRNMSKPDDQTLQIIDVLQEARQRALTQRVTMRVEIDLTDNVVRLYDEKKSPVVTSDDELKRQVALLPATEVNIERRASNVASNPPETLPVTSAVYRPSIYTPSATHRVCTLRFQSSGTIVDEIGNPISGVTLHVWSPTKADPTAGDIVRAITVIGTTNSVRMWEFRKDSIGTYKWFDSRR